MVHFLCSLLEYKLETSSSVHLLVAHSPKNSNWNRARTRWINRFSEDLNRKTRSWKTRKDARSQIQRQQGLKPIHLLIDLCQTHQLKIKFQVCCKRLKLEAEAKTDITAKWVNFLILRMCLNSLPWLVDLSYHVQTVAVFPLESQSNRVNDTMVSPPPPSPFQIANVAIRLKYPWI